MEGRVVERREPRARAAGGAHLQLGLVEHAQPLEVDDLGEPAHERAALRLQPVDEVVLRDEVDVPVPVRRRDLDALAAAHERHLRLRAELVVRDREREREVGDVALVPWREAERER